MPIRGSHAWISQAWISWILGSAVALLKEYAIKNISKLPTFLLFVRTFLTKNIFLHPLLIFPDAHLSRSTAQHYEGECAWLNKES